MSKAMDVLDTPSANAIQAYCATLAQERGLTLERVRWSHTPLPDHHQNPYRLLMCITYPFIWDCELWFTESEVLGYATDITTAVVEAKIRTEVEDSYRVWKKWKEEG